jgi:hypothetical protein
VSQVVRLGDTEETDGGPLRLDTHEELCALETFFFLAQLPCWARFGAESQALGQRELRQGARFLP